MGWYSAPEIAPRDLADNPRCPECKTGTMFHPAHRRGPCIVVMPGRGPCGCTAHEAKEPTHA